MEKLMLVMIASLVSGSSMNTLECPQSDHCFRPAFNAELKRVKPAGFGAFTYQNAVSKKDHKVKKKLIFIDWRRLYWGKLSDLVYGPHELQGDDPQEDVREIVDSQDQDIYSIDTQDALEFARELRQELKSFARQYGFQIVWRKKPSDIRDGTDAFLEYWDRGFSQRAPGKTISFAQLCALSAQTIKPQNSASRKRA